MLNMTQKNGSKLGVKVLLVCRQTTGDLGLYYTLWDEEGGGVCGVGYNYGITTSNLLCITCISINREVEEKNQIFSLK